MSKLTLTVAFAAGYVVGAKAGRDRYEQIRSSAQKGAHKVAENPQVQAAAEAVKDKAGEVASSVAETAKEKAADAVGAVKEKAAETGPTIQAAP